MDEARHRGEFSGEIVEIPVYNTYYVEPLCPYIQYLFTESPQWLYGPARSSKHIPLFPATVMTT